MISLAALLTVALAGTPASPPPEAPPEPTAAAAPAPPAARREPVVDTYHGVAVTDPYRWLEDGASPEVQAWSDAQNAWARAHLDGLPSAPALRQKIGAILDAISGSHYSLRWQGGRLFAQVFQPPKQQPFVVVMPSADRPGEERVVVDPNLLDPAGGTSIDWYVPSPDGKRLAVSLSAGGSESGDVHVFDAEGSGTNAEVAEVVPRVNGGTAGGSLAWVADGSGFYHTRYPAPGERPAEDLAFYQQVYFHRLGTPPAEDRYEIGRDFPKIAEIKLHADPSSPRIVAEVQDGDSGRFTYHLREADGTWRRLAGYDDAVVQAAWGPAGDLFLISYRGAPRGRVLRLPPGATSLEAAATVVEEGPDPLVPLFWQPPSIVATATRLYLIYQLGGPSQIRVFDHAGHPQAAPRQLPVAAVGEIARLDGDVVLFANGSFLEPVAWYRFDPAQGEAGETVKTALAETSPVDLAEAEVVREFAVSKDGTRVPVNVIRKKGIRLDGSHPALLTGYGGYSYSLQPGLNPLARVWLDVGGVYAIANLRGGGEFGTAWHEAGRLTQKQNVFDDFAAAMKLLVDAGYTRPERLAISGASNGGLLMGAMIVQHPAACRAVASSVGVYDMLRSELTPNGSFNVPEYGSVADPEQFRALYAYSPYHRVVDGTAYPAVLLATGANDPRVDPMHSRKFLARLQAATSSDRPILLRTSSSTGHGVGSPLAAIVEQIVDQYAFLFDQLGVIYPPAKP